MATIHAIRGLLLEEVLLNLLRDSGYVAIDKANTSDKTLKNGRSGLEVKGRGWNHQIDAIADFSVSPPFSHPIRLLLEAKFYNKNIGIDIIRNAVGVLKDVGEYWVTNDNNDIYKPRYHYQYAVFTSSAFTKPAQKYAFAQDIYLIKLENNEYFQPVIDSLKQLTYEDFNGTSGKEINIDLSDLRVAMRKSLKYKNPIHLENFIKFNNFPHENNLISLVFNESNNLSSSYLGVLGKGFPVFLTPSDSFNIQDLIRNPRIRICWNEEKWYIVKETVNCRDYNDEDIVFSFDLPKELLKLYSENNMLSEAGALDLKQEFMSSIKIMFKDQDNRIMSFLELKLDNQWIDRIREQLL